MRNESCSRSKKTMSDYGYAMVNIGTSVERQFDRDDIASTSGTDGKNVSNAVMRTKKSLTSDAIT